MRRPWGALKGADALMRRHARGRAWPGHGLALAVRTRLASILCHIIVLKVFGEWNFFNDKYCKKHLIGSVSSRSAP